MAEELGSHRIESFKTEDPNKIQLLQGREIVLKEHISAKNNLLRNISLALQMFLLPLLNTKHH